MHPAAAGKCRSTPATSSITTTKRSSFAITKAKSSSIPKLETKASSSRRSGNITTNTFTPKRLLSFRAKRSARNDKSSLPLFEHNFAADDRHHVARFQDFRLGNFHDVLREHGKVSELTDFDCAFVFFF